MWNNERYSKIKKSNYTATKRDNKTAMSIHRNMFSEETFRMLQMFSMDSENI